jgi:Carboxypeptidase regulatory-like domain
MRQARTWLAVACGVTLWLAPVRASAQADAGTDIITGVVTDVDRNPVESATVEAYSLQTEVTRRAHTDVHGRYTILFPDGGGQYRMTARMLGMAPRVALLVRDADEDRLVWDARLGGGGVTLDTLTVEARGRLPAGERPTPGETQRAFTPDQLAQLPIDQTDLASLVGLVPGVLPIAGTDSTASSFSVAGLGPDANAVTLDGLLFGNTSVPQEGLRQTRVVTGTYDVSRGQFSGGLVASISRSGSNVLQGSGQYQFMNQDVAIDAGSTPYSQGFTQNQLSGGLGGPLVKDRVFVFASGLARLRADPQQTLLSAGANNLAQLGVAPDSVARFLRLVDSLGLSSTSVAGSDTRARDIYAGMVRFDWVLTNAHTLTLRGNWNGTALDPSRTSPLSLPQAAGKNTTSAGGVMATMTSRFGATVLNLLKGFWQGSANHGDPFTFLPQGRVQVASTLPDTTMSVTTLVFGGNAGLPSRSTSSSFEASDEVSWLPGAGAHRFKVGADWLTERSDNLLGGDQYGTYTYNSLADLASDSAATFRRTLGVTQRRSYDQQWGLYAGDVWMASRPFQLTYGVRLEGSSFGDPPVSNPAVDSAFGVRTDRLPIEWHVSPRAGFTWTLGSASAGGLRYFQPAQWVVRGGIGEFRSRAPTSLVAQARAATGLGQSTAQLYCFGGGVPVPDWGQYGADPATIPAACDSAGGGGPVPAGIEAAPSVLALTPGFEAPRAWRASLGVERRITQLLRLSVEASWAQGTAQTGLTDLNLNATPRFTLADEGNRPVFVTPGDIDAATGAPSFVASRVDPAFSQVLLARSNLETRAEQLTATLGGVVGPGIVFSASYTWQRARDQQTGVRASTAGDPNVAEWAPSSYGREHSFVLSLTYPFSTALEITSVGRLTSGIPFTPMVGGDVNGDGLRDDRAYVFAPGTATPVAQAMAQLLAGASASVRDCLSRQIGAVATRNSCTGPWQGSLDFQLNWRPAFWGLDHRLQVSVLTYNFLYGLDELLHGVTGAHGWGLQTRPDPTLLYVSGFDPGTQSYVYQVNGRFGATSGAATAYRPPFQVGLQVRLAIGPDRVRAALDAMRSGGGGGRGGMGGFAGGGGGFGGRFGGGGQGGFRPQLSPEAMAARIDSALPNPAGIALAMRDSLKLDSGQVVLLTPLRDSLAARNGERVDSLHRVFQRVGNTPDRSQLITLMPKLRPLFQAARADVAQAIVDVRAILSEEQWAEMPASVRDFQATPVRRFRGAPGPRP